MAQTLSVQEEAKGGFIPQYDHLNIEQVVYVSSCKLFHGFIM